MELADILLNINYVPCQKAFVEVELLTHRRHSS
jgi:hypothetical protein